MNLIRFDQVSLEFGDTPLLHTAEFAIGPGERVCLIGRNGAGKSSLLKLITGELQPDSGRIQSLDGIEISQLEQSLPEGDARTVREVVKSGMAAVQALVDAYHARAAAELDARGLRELEDLQHRLEAHGGWQVDQQVDALITQLKLPADKRMETLSGGWRRRVALGKALVAKPDLLLLDEPTNHLDIGTIEWLEQTVRDFPGAVLFITHDRAFLQKLATRIVELDRGRLTSWPGDYRNFLEQKEQWLETEERQNALFDRKLAQEEAWIRQGIKARRTRNMGRVRALKAMRETRAARLAQQGKARLRMEEADPSGRKVIEARHITHGYQGRTLIEDFSIKIMRGDRIGLIGNNGVGKTTLLRILLGELAPERGHVQLGTNLEVAYFDQLRTTLELDKTVADNVGEGRDHVRINGKDRHIIGYLQDFLFSARRARQPVRALSGGERNRIILAKLFTRPANLLVMDEPTNDLDIEMLEVLEERLVDYPGTLLLVSHDRTFVDNVVTSTLVFESRGRVREYVGGYSDWLRRGHTLARADAVEAPQPSLPKSPPVTSARAANPAKPRKLSYKLQRELDQLPERIEVLEAKVGELQARISDPAFYNEPQTTIQKTLAELDTRQTELDRALERWAELEDMKAALEGGAR
ncbi:ATP-binding cassette domain-containing protein [Nitrococcus mobilis]|uniref:ATP-binding protein Uup n=1 Tax=Nitrococcus mobilis Nb-231 TaxID=314278 RepID=A4BLA8_9GAMM|nr:ATP-binding cassette domain-containing protein [Nitrococcus mobilis]EAR23096.1 probable ATP-binding component of ABC transporter [Nitrococcus mobilis Nb-231]